ncbi:DUF3794 domain-containing protein [Sporohalobacter salinus]|uniref:DUF3794 domain-containing protein n=1 Tax=Sporohalobacter salinus TaxID=1494606 RepID=UPI001961594B|nr:DUF3794 domain-containing protein [Sporohalobacter salinus]MBM7625141.1 hypothetical protein [Sporohalobacter salinus]
MNKDNLFICELITIDQNFKYISPYVESKEFIKEKNLLIPHIKPDIQQLVKIIIKPKITSKKIIYTPENYKLIVNGIITENIHYVADNKKQSVHCTQFKFSFYNFINLYHNQIKDIKIRIDDVFIQLCKKRFLKQSMLMSICVIPKRKCYH